MASLHQWAAKGAHWLTLERMLEPGDAVGLVGPVGWLPAAFCAAAWWAGLAVQLAPAPETVTLRHEAADPQDSGETVWFGDGFDGSPMAAVPGEAYTVAVQAFPDQPPAPHAKAALPAVLGGNGGRLWSQQQLLVEARSRWEPKGTLGVELGVLDPVTALLATAARPLATGHATVVLDGVERDEVAAEGVAIWA